MTDSGAGFAVDLYRLDKVAKDYLPTVAGVYDSAIGKCQGGEAALGEMSKVPDQFHGSGGPVSSAYGQLNGAIVDVLKSTKTSLDETANALHEAVSLHAATDQGAADRIEQLMQERGTPKPEGTP
ncbi:hypothetical protein FHX42_003694 [Saccharopolyspora lacisalsi]|uniref:Excreted virulence factor EspC (Type VII ESX diderm) n=1 Tax=Halosaccharopolyspora lacisalsi TaxID=1000566 RepID=A0A839E605_9PSEU|nr:hypothetical protein [Halosaccharopolyspora lacisalsi]MBA8826318.1 hypothetical protein [Halosaccharopolyspora lacisalsi]